MGAKRAEYQIVGRYMNGKEVVAYHLQSLGTGKSGRYSKEQVCYLVGRGQITNCEGQLYQDKVLLRGVGISLDDLPTHQEDGRMSKTDSLGHIRKGKTTNDIMSQVIIVGVITSGRNVVGYCVQNAGGGRTTIDKEKLLSLAKEGKIGNARVQMYQGSAILKGINCNLKELPKYDVSKQQQVQ